MDSDAPNTIPPIHLWQKREIIFIETMFAVTSLFGVPGVPDVERKVRQTMERMPTCCSKDNGVSGDRGCCKERFCCLSAREDVDSTLLGDVESKWATKTHSLNQISRDLSDDLGMKRRILICLTV